MAKAIAVEEGNANLERLKEQPQKLGAFLTDVRSELRKVSTPSRSETQSTTIVVIVTVFAFAAYFWAVDYGLNHTINALITKLTQH
jgi:preprotein translocase subunit SecE